MEKIVSLCKRRGFVYQGSEIYGGLRGTWDYGPLGVMLKQNILNTWWDHFVTSRDDMYGLDAAILMNEKVWGASGHTGAGFTDPIIEDTKTGQRFRADHFLKDNGIDPDGMSLEDMSSAVKENGLASLEGNPLSEVRQFNLMFETKVGAEGATTSYLRPETAQGIFVNFKNVVDSMHPKLPFGIAQIGKAFRNEIAPRDFLFRVREFEQMEIEYFVPEGEWETYFETFRKRIQEWHELLGLSGERIREYEVPADELAHYSKRTIDFEYDYPGKGFDELAGFAYRTDFDLTNHMEHSGVDIRYTDADGNKFIPHVLEPSFGLGRAFLAVLSEAYTEDEMGGETRTYLKLPSHLAPYRAMVSPLLKNKPQLVEKAKEVREMLRQSISNVAWDDNGNIGKRYRRQDEIGTPYCITIDFDTLEGEHEGTVTVRSRDSGQQERVAIDNLVNVLV